METGMWQSYTYNTYELSQKERHKSTLTQQIKLARQGNNFSSFDMTHDENIFLAKIHTIDNSER